MSDFIDDLIAQSPNLQRKVAEEELIQEAVEAIWDVMIAQGVSQAELASRLGTTPSNVSQTLRGTRNMTLRNLAGIAHSLGKAVRLVFVKRESAAHGDWQVQTQSQAVQSRNWTLPGVFQPHTTCAANDSYIVTSKVAVGSTR